MNCIEKSSIIQAIDWKNTSEGTSERHEAMTQVNSPTKNISIGISLGTKYCCVGVFRNGKFELIPNELGERSTPSVVAFNEKELFVGRFALNQGYHNLTNTIFNVKRFIGKSIDDQKVKSEMDYATFEVKPHSKSRLCFGVNVEGREDITPKEICGIILRNQKNIAEKYLGCEVNDVVITVPSLFNNSQREATKDAAIIAGFKNIRLINESTAVALAHGIENTRKEDRRTVMIFNLGGGSFDVSIVKISNKSEIKVISNSGDPHFGGEDFDQLLFSHFAAEFQNIHKKNIFKDMRATRKLQTACEKIKLTLTHSTEAQMEIDDLFDGIDFKLKITRQQFHKICFKLFEKIKFLVDRVLQEVHYKESDIDDVVLVGGSSRIPFVEMELGKLFDKKKLKFSINREEAAVYGAAIKADNLDCLKITNVVTINIRFLTENKFHNERIERNTVIDGVVFNILSSHECTILEREHLSTKDYGILGSVQIRTHSKQLSVVRLKSYIDESGILNVSALSLEAEKSNPLGIEVVLKTSKLEESEADRMIKRVNKIFTDNKSYHDQSESRNKREEFEIRIKRSMKSQNLEKRINSEQLYLEFLKWIKSNKSAGKDEIDKYIDECHERVLK